LPLGVVKIKNRLIVVMGTTGCGKSTIGAALASAIDAEYLEGDDYHSRENKAKMSAGCALDDNDRWPWLQCLSQVMAASSGRVVVSCSSLKRSYRSLICDNTSEPVLFVHLHGTKEVIASRLADRKNHFMDSGLLDSQLATLEPLNEREHGFTVDINRSVDDIVKEVTARVL